jgi:hypothetical protein
MFDLNASLGQTPALTVPAPGCRGRERVDQSEQIPESVQELLRERIESHDELEAALLLRADPERAWVAGELGAALELSPELGAHVEAKLIRARIARPVATEDLRIRYRPVSATVAKAMDQLAALWESEPIEILRLMSANALDRVREKAADTFSLARVPKV